jgi:hypothetical protein
MGGAHIPTPDKRTGKQDESHQHRLVKQPPAERKGRKQPARPSKDYISTLSAVPRASLWGRLLLPIRRTPCFTRLGGMRGA